MPKQTQKTQIQVSLVFLLIIFCLCLLIMSYAQGQAKPNVVELGKSHRLFLTAVEKMAVDAEKQVLERNFNHEKYTVVKNVSKRKAKSSVLHYQGFLQHGSSTTIWITELGYQDGAASLPEWGEVTLHVEKAVLFVTDDKGYTREFKAGDIIRK